MSSFAGNITLARRTELKNWHIFAILALLTLANMWLNETFLMTREVYHLLLSERMETQRIDEYFNTMSKFAWWSYVIAPVVLWTRFAFVSLLLQFPLTARFVEVPFTTILRIVMVASIPLLSGSFAKLIWALRLPASGINEASLASVPLALTNFFDFYDFPQSAWSFLTNFNLFEAGWCTIVATGFVRTRKLSGLDATLLTLVVWTAILVFQWVLMLYVTKVNS